MPAAEADYVDVALDAVPDAQAKVFGGIA